MMVNKVTSAYDAYAVAAHPRKVERQNRDAEERDAVTTSARAKEYQYARQALAGVPDVRADKVAALKQRIDSGSYAVASGDVAAKFMAAIGSGEHFA